mgnify:CR=1 FL=1
MDFSYSEEQQMLQDSVSKFISTEYDWDSRQAIAKSETGFSADHWQLFAELGWLTVPFKEDDGGFGGSAVDIQRKLGAHLARGSSHFKCLCAAPGASRRIVSLAG